MPPRTLHAPAIPFAVQLQPADFVAARRLLLTPRPVMQRILWVWAAIMVPACLWLTYFGWVRGRWHPLLLPLVGAGLFFAFYFFILLPLTARQSFAPQEVSGEISEGGLTMQTAGSRDTLRWTEIRRWRHNDRVAVLFVSEDIFNVLPWRAFSTPADRAAAFALLEQKLGNSNQN